MSGASTTIMAHDVSGPVHLAGDGGHSSLPILQPVFIPRGATLNSTPQIPNSPLGTTQTASADWAYLLRSAAAMTQPNQGQLGSALDGLGTGSSPNNIQDLVSAGMRSSPQFNSSPNLLYSPASSAAPASNYFNSMVDIGTDGLGNSAGDHANSLVMQLSNNNNLAAAAAAASAMYCDSSGVQTLYPSSSDALTAAANAARQAVQTQTLLQQQAAAVNSLSTGLGNLGLSPLAANGLSNTMEESLGGSLFAAAAAAAAATTAAAASKPVSASLYIKNLPPDADKLFLYEKFSPFGAILSVKVLVDPQTGQCRGVGFVNFAEHASAMRSIQALHGTKVGDKSMHVSLQTPRIRASALHGM